MPKEKKSLTRVALRIKRREKGYSQKKMALMLHVTQQAVSFYESGKREVPADVLERIAQL